MEKNQNKPNNQLRTVSMLTQKTNEDFNKKQPSINDIDPKQVNTEIKLPKTAGVKKNTDRINNISSPIETKVVSAKNNSNNNMIYEFNIKDSYAMQSENIQKNIANSKKICKNRFV